MGGRGPNQAPHQSQGKAYLDKNFPKLDGIKTATIEEGSGMNDGPEPPEGARTCGRGRACPARGTCPTLLLLLVAGLLFPADHGTVLATTDMHGNLFPSIT